MIAFFKNLFQTSKEELLNQDVIIRFMNFNEIQYNNYGISVGGTQYNWNEVKEIYCDLTTLTLYIQDITYIIRGFRDYDHIIQYQMNLTQLKCTFSQHVSHKKEETT